MGHFCYPAQGICAALHRAVALPWGICVAPYDLAACCAMTKRSWHVSLTKARHPHHGIAALSVANGGKQDPSAVFPRSHVCDSCVGICTSWNHSWQQQSRELSPLHPLQPCPPCLFSHDLLSLSVLTMTSVNAAQGIRFKPRLSDCNRAEGVSRSVGQACSAHALGSQTPPAQPPC